MTSKDFVYWLKTHKNIIRTIIVIISVSLCFVYFGFEDIFKDYLIYKALLIFLNLVTFIGIVFPITIKKNITKSDIIKIVQKDKKDDEINKIIKERSSL